MGWKKKYKKLKFRYKLARENSVYREAAYEECRATIKQFEKSIRDLKCKLSILM